MTRLIDETHDPSLRSWVDTANQAETDFPIQNLPFGVFRRLRTPEPPRIGVAIGDGVLDLSRCSELGLLDGLSSEVIAAIGASSLNSVMAMGPRPLTLLRRRLSRVLHTDGRRAEPSALVPMLEAEMFLPAAVGDYTDFYASIAHASNVGRLFRPENPLLPNYKHMPVGYHGRSSSLVISGTSVTRPRGQMRPHGVDAPEFCPAQCLDYELEVGAFVGLRNERGHPVQIDDAEDHIFGLCLVNDWSARDLQAWEAQPLGPFLSKSFATSVSPWVVTLEALAPYRCAPFARQVGDPPLLPYLSSARNRATGGINMTVEAWLRTSDMRDRRIEPVRLSRGSLRDMYWTLAQMVVHQTSNGCCVRPGDLLASGTISGPHEGSEGCLLEITRQGTRPLTLPTGEKRGFLADGDEVTFRGNCNRDGYARIGFGPCVAVVLAAPD